LDVPGFPGVTGGCSKDQKKKSSGGESRREISQDECPSAQEKNELVQPGTGQREGHPVIGSEEKILLNKKIRSRMVEPSCAL